GRAGARAGDWPRRGASHHPRPRGRDLPAGLWLAHAALHAAWTGRGARRRGPRGGLRLGVPDDAGEPDHRLLLRRQLRRARDALLVAGVFLGSTCWWTLLVAAASRLRQRFTRSGLAIANRVAGIVIIAFGVATLAGLALEAARGGG
ncbi:MAG: LysE family transporter, partial [Alphaproteobacteria bacterium]